MATKITSQSTQETRINDNTNIDAVNVTLNKVDKMIESDDVVMKVHPSLDLSDPPVLNVLDEKVFKARVALVFKLIAETLAKSYGPYGSSTIISNASSYHVTKDGWNIMTYLSCAKDKTGIDDAIYELIKGPCARLNYAVGDSTTTVIEATYEIYRVFMKVRHQIDKLGLSPREILKAYNTVRDAIIKALDDEIVYIDPNDHADMVDKISKIAFISSNGDEEVTKIITELYDELDNPMINITKSVTDKTTKNIVEGYFFNAILKDGMYVNNDSMTGKYTDVDILIFDHKITMRTFDELILPLNEDCRAKGRHLVIIATGYDEVAMITIRKRLTKEYEMTNGKVNLILMVGSMAFGTNRDLCEDLAMLLNTTIIGMGLEEDMIKKIKANEGWTFRNVLDTNQRNIPNITITVNNAEGQIGYAVDTGNVKPEFHAFELDEDAVRVGFAGAVTFGMKGGSTFNELHYSKERYDQTIRMLQHKLEESRKKSEAVTSYNFQAQDIQTRLYSLKMKLGTIDVGGQSGLSQNMLYDAVTDAVKATASAYSNGYTKGCSVSILRATANVINTFDQDTPSIYWIIADAIFFGFCSVYKIILNSKYTDDAYEWADGLNDLYNILRKSFNYAASYDKFCEEYRNSDHRVTRSIIMKNTNNAFDRLIKTSIQLNKPFDLTKNDFSDDIINTAKSDKEVLLATSDLISLLITGNQFIITE